MPDEGWPAAAALAAMHHGVLTWDQLLGAGIAATTVRRWERAGRLRRAAPAVYVVAGSPETWRQRTSIATLDAAALASHRCAAALHGLDGHPGRSIEVIAERWRRSSRRTFYKVHETKDLRGADVDERDGIACTSLVRTLIDLAAVEHPFRVAQAFDHAVRQDREVLALARARFLELARRGRNGTRAFRRLLEERTGGYIPPGSTFEAMTVRALETGGVPEPVRQHKVVDGDFVAYIDLSWPPVRFGLECDSLAHHFGEHGIEHDRVRRRHLKRLGWEIVEYTYREVASDPAGVAREVKQLLHLAAVRSGVDESRMRL